VQRSGVDIVDRVEVLVKKSYYTYERYELDATFAMLYHEQPITPAELGQYVRISDHLVQLDEKHYFIIFAYTEHDSAVKASQNLVHKLDHHFNDHTSCIALDSFNPSKSAKIVLKRLQAILDETRSRSYTRVETEEIFDH
jgi:hypothetical protein